MEDIDLSEQLDYARVVQSGADHAAEQPEDARYGDIFRVMVEHVLTAEDRPEG